MIIIIFCYLSLNISKILHCSSLSIYIHNLENLDDISKDEHQALDIFIDQLYEEMDNGKKTLNKTLLEK